MVINDEYFPEMEIQISSQRANLKECENINYNETIRT